MKTRTIINSFILTASMTLGVAQASYTTNDELFDSLQPGDENSIQHDEAVEFSKMELKDVDSNEEITRKLYIDESLSTHIEW